MRYLTRTPLAAAAVLTATLVAAPTHADGGLEIFLESALAVDETTPSVTLPLHSATHRAADGRTQTVYYVVTESSDEEDAEKRGVSPSPKLANALGTTAVQQATVDADGRLVLPGTVDFAPERVFMPGPSGFPPAAASPGSTGDAAYSPLVALPDGTVINAPQVANDSGVHDKVIAIDYSRATVTLRLTAGFYHGKEMLYVSTDASDPVAAALEEATFAPNLNAAPGLASADPLTSARSAIIPIVNGQTGIGNPQRQGLASASFGEGSPLNITEIHPRNKGKFLMYSPLWDVHPAVWTDGAIAAGERIRLDHHEDVIDAIEAGFIASGGAGPRNRELAGLRSAGFIVNCPVVTLR